MNRLEEHLEHWIKCGVSNLDRTTNDLARVKEANYPPEAIHNYELYNNENKRWLLWVLEMCLDYHLKFP